MSVVLHRAVAVVGIGCRFPGGVRSQSDLQNLLENGIDAVSTLPFDRFDVHRYWHSNQQAPGSFYATGAGLVGDVRRFDARFWGFSEKEAQNLDPQQRMILEMTWEAFEDAGICPSQAAGSNTAVCIGAASADMAMAHADDLAMTGPYTMTGTQMSIISNRVSYCFDFHGPSLTVDTACSSSLVAVNEACRLLDSHQVDMAVAGGVNILLAPMGFVGFSKAHMLSTHGKCRVFDKDGNGYVRSEGGAVVLLKTLEKALEDGDEIHAVIRAAAVNSDGKTAGIALPNAKAQAQLLQSIYSPGNIDAKDLVYVEAHGTGTSVGDPIEASAIGSVLGRKDDEPLYVGSIKSNVGHLETASGMAGLLKSVCVLENDRIFKNIHFDNPNPAIDFAGLGIRVPTSNMPVKTVAGKSLVGVNSFGFGGTNAHIVLQKAPESRRESVEQGFCQTRFPLMIFAKSKESLALLADAYAKLIEGKTFAQYQELCAAVHLQRERMAHCLIVRTEDITAAVEALKEFAQRNKTVAGVSYYDRNGIASAENSTDEFSKTAFVFSGNGSQWTGMGQSLYAQSPQFKKVVDEIDVYFAPLAGWELKQFFAENGKSPDLSLTEYAQPALFACQLGILSILKACGIQAKAFVGHSVGEVAAAYAAGALTLEDAVGVIYARSIRQSQKAGLGTMATVHVSAEAFESLCRKFGSVSVAGINSADNFTVSGSKEDLEVLKQEVVRLGGTYTALSLNYAFHSSSMDSLKDELIDDLATIHPRSCVGFYSTVFGKKIDGQELDGEYWWKNVRQTVRFSDAIQSMIEDGICRFMEIGPHAILIGYLRSILRNKGKDGWIGYAMRRGDDASAVAGNAMKALCCGWPDQLDWPQVARDRTLPRYQWNYKVYWPESTTLSHRLFAAQTVDPMLGWPVAQAQNTWINRLDAHSVEWLSGHSIDGSVVFPAAGFIEAAIAAARLSKKTDGAVELINVSIVRAMPLEERVFLHVTTSVDHDGKIVVQSRPATGQDSETVVHLVGRCSALEAPFNDKRSFEASALGTSVDVQAFYRKLADLGLNYSGSFKSVRALWCNKEEVIAQLELSEAIDQRAMHLSVPLTDAVLQSVFALLPEKYSLTEAYLPTRFEKVIHVREGLPAWSVARIQRFTVGSLTVSFDVFDSQGQLLARFENVRYVRYPGRKNRIEPAFYREVLRAQSHCGVAQECVEDIVRILKSGNAHNEVAPARFAQLLTAAYAYEAVQKFDCVKPAELLFSLDTFIEKVEYAEFLANLLVSANLATRQQAGFCVKSQARIPSTDVILRTALVQCPMYWPLWLSISAVGRHLSDILADRVRPDALMPRKNFSIFQQCRMTPAVQSLSVLVRKCIALLAAQARDDHQVRVAVICGKMPETIKELYDSSLKNVCWTIFADKKDAVLDRCRTTLSMLDRLEVKPAEQFKLSDRSYDAVVVPEGFGRRPMLTQAFGEVNGALKEGCLYLALEDAAGSAVDFIEGGADGWFGTEDGEVVSTLPQFDAWERLLTKARMGVVKINEAPSCLCNIVAAVKHSSETSVVFDDAHGTDLKDAFALYCPEDSVKNLTTVLLVLDAPICSSLQEALHHSQIVSFEDCGFENIPQKSFLLSQELIKGNKPVDWTVVAVTGSAFAAVTGLKRVVENECPLIRVRCIGLADQTQPSLEFLKKCLTKDAVSEDEFEIRKAVMYAPRIEKLDSNDQSDSDYLSLSFDAPGKLERLYWKTTQRKAIKPDEICIRVKAAALNFRDVMWAMGLLPEEALENGFSGPTMGLEAAGVVIETGSDVTEFSVGDEVMAFAPQCLAQEIVTKACAVTHKPDTLSFEEAAAVPVAFFTAWYAIKEMGRALEGESILIHGAAGGVGLAALQIANLLGLKVYATAGSDIKRALLRSLGVEHVYDSRSLAFAQEIMRDTQGRGVDLVLNSLAGDGAEKSLSVLAPFGRFLELGKRDFYADNPLFLRPFGRNLSYYGIDVDQLLISKPSLAEKLFAELIRAFEEGKLRALPLEVFPMSCVTSAFALMQSSAHVGKIVIRMDQHQDRRQTHTNLALKFSEQGTYVITGGLGGLGQKTAKRFVELGARHLVLVSSKGVVSQQQKDFVDQMQKIGVDLQTPAIDIASDDVQQKLHDAIRAMPPVKGIVHAAGVIDDAALTDMTVESMRRVWRVKVLGALHLDQWTKSDGLDPDFFVVFSSATVLLGNPGQANYVAANAALESLVKKRREQGLKALSVGWGPVADVGMLQGKDRVRGAIEKTLGTQSLTSDQVVDALLKAIAADAGCVHFFSADWHKLRSLPVLGDARFDGLIHLDAEPNDQQGALKDLLVGKSQEEGVAILTDIVAGEVARLMGIAREEVNVRTPVSDLGMDSLTVLELSTWLEEKLQTRIPSAAMFAGASVEAIAQRFYQTATEGKTGEDSLVDAMSRQHAVKLTADMRSEMIAVSQGDSDERH